MPFVMKALEKHQYDSSFYTLVSEPKNADYVLIPHDYWRLKQVRPDLLQKMIVEAEAHHKPILIDASGDRAGVVAVPNAVVLRINQYRFELPPYEIKIPVICEDLLETYAGGIFTARNKSDLPVVGFAGWGHLTFLQRIRTFIKEIPIRVYRIFDARLAAKVKGVFWRERAIKIFNRSSRIRTNFLVRSSYSGHVATIEGEFLKNRLEFVTNILDSDYTLIIRGDANEATRFYETLSLGRIPVVIDTAMVFPLEDRINYKDFCLFIDYHDLKSAPDIIADFHKTLSPEDFIKMQKKARHVFETYLRYDVFSRHLALLLKERALPLNS